ncbi:MAG: hypothetical protein QOI57_801, partial [Rubrobacteraceae bacterium]|nr:hypothetical protein [Rubrobacteraceae bacterium]
AWEFGKRQERAEAARQAGKLEEAIDEYRAALKLRRGAFLAEEPYEDWAIEVREEWQERHLAILSGLSECLALRGRYTEAIEACNHALVLDLYRESLYRQLMLYHYCAGEQALALQVFRRYARVLKEELSTVPSPDLARLKAQIEARDVPGVDTLRRYPRPRRPLRFRYSLGRTHFVGRDQEYALLAERLKEVLEGSGGAVAVEGEAGVGKTRLVEEFLGYARSCGACVLSGRCYERELGPTLEPIVDALGSLPAMGERTSGILYPGGEEPGYLQEAEPYDNSSRVYHTLTRELIRGSHDDSYKGLVLFVDDVQWADSVTLGFLSYLAKRLSGEQILLVVAYRREDAAGLSGWLDHLAERRAMSTLSLSRLSIDDTSELLERMSSRAFGELPYLADFLQRESEGNPFYAVEYLRWLIEAGVVEIGARRRISGLKSELLQESALPSGVRSLIQARLRGLNEEARDLLMLAAVIGRTFDLELLCNAAAHGEASIFRIMEPLMASGLIVEASEEAYHFSHDKLRQALYEDIWGYRRRGLHLRVAATLEEADGEPAELAHHYLRAQAWQPALENLVKAARKVEESYAWDAALKSYARALEVVGKLPDPEETRFELLGARESLLERIGLREERATTVQEMFELANRMGDRARIAEVHVRRIGVLTALSDPTGALEAGQAAVTIFRELGHKADEARAHREMSYVCWVNQDYAGSLEANFRALQIHRELGDRPGEAGDAGNIAQVYRSMGDYEQALRWVEEASRIYDELGDKASEVVRMDTVATLHRYGGGLATTLPLSLKSLRFLTEFGSKNFFVTQHSTCGTLYLDLGAPEEALEYFRASSYFDRER